MKKKELLKLIKQSECELLVIEQQLNTPIFEDVGMATGIALSHILGDISATREKLKYFEIH